MLSGQLFTLTFSSHTVPSWPSVIPSVPGGSWSFTANHQNGQMLKIQHCMSSLRSHLNVIYPLQLPPPPPRTRPHQLLIQPISRAALFTRKPWSHPLTVLLCLIVAFPGGTHTTHNPLPSACIWPLNKTALLICILVVSNKDTLKWESWIKAFISVLIKVII